MFNAGDMIIYGTTGVCQVEDVCNMTMPLNAGERLCYVLRPLYQSGTISTPVDNDRIVMRAVISKAEAEKLIDGIPDYPDYVFTGKDMRQLGEHYMEIVRTFDCKRLIVLAKTIYNKRQMMLGQKRKFGAVDEKYLKLAEDLLFGELACALEIPREEVVGYIEKRVAAKTGNA